MNKPKTTKALTCQNCGAEFVRLDAIYARFCSLECGQQWERGNRFLLFRRDGFRCGYCGDLLDGDGKPPTLDHIIPRSAGGKDTAENLVTVCSKCNSRKGAARLSDDFLAHLRSEITERNTRAGIDPALIVRAHRT